MTTSALDAEPACPGADSLPPERDDVPSDARERSARALRAVRRPLDAIPRDTWDRLAGLNEWATPFASWPFHRAWWDAYAASAHEETFVLVPDDGPDDAEPVAIAPLMHRHEVEPTDADTYTKMRHGGAPDLTAVPPTAKAIFFGASYHADYATLLAAPADLPAVADALVARLGAPVPADDPNQMPWDVVDLRRLRCGDPAADELARAFGAREMPEGWTLNVEREDVCPVVSLPAGGTFDEYLSTLGKKERHEIRRKVRRAETAGPVTLRDSDDPLRDLEIFIELHQRRWGPDGLFPPTPGGEASRVFFRRLFELSGPDGPVRLTFLTVAGRCIASGVHFETDDAILYYNAGIDPEARELSPGMVMIAKYMERALATGKRRLDFLRGDEPYKYEWGAVDEPIQRLLVRRTGNAR